MPAYDKYLNSQPQNTGKSYEKYLQQTEQYSPEEALNEQGVSERERGLINNLQDNPELIQKWLIKKGYDAKVNSKGDVVMRKAPNEPYKKIEHEGDWYNPLSWELKDFTSDAANEYASLGGMAKGAAMGAAPGSLLSPIGSVAGGIVGAGAGAAAVEAARRLAAKGAGFEETLPEAAKSVLEEGLYGAAAEVGGHYAGKAIGAGLKAGKNYLVKGAEKEALRIAEPALKESSEALKQTMGDISKTQAERAAHNIERKTAWKNRESHLQAGKKEATDFANEFETGMKSQLGKETAETAKKQLRKDLYDKWSQTLQNKLNESTYNLTETEAILEKMGRLKPLAKEADKDLNFAKESLKGTEQGVKTAAQNRLEAESLLSRPKEGGPRKLESNYGNIPEPIPVAKRETNQRLAKNLRNKQVRMQDKAENISSNAAQIKGTIRAKELQPSTYLGKKVQKIGEILEIPERATIKAREGITSQWNTPRTPAGKLANPELLPQNLKKATQELTDELQRFKNKVDLKMPGSNELQVAIDRTINKFPKALLSRSELNDAAGAIATTIKQIEEKHGAEAIAPIKKTLEKIFTPIANAGGLGSHFGIAMLRSTGHKVFGPFATGAALGLSGVIGPGGLTGAVVGAGLSKIPGAIGRKLQQIGMALQDNPQSVKGPVKKVYQWAEKLLTSKKPITPELERRIAIMLKLAENQE